MELDIDTLLREAVESTASDLHLTVGVPPMIRVVGTIQPLDYPPLTPEDTFQLAYSMLNTFQKQQFERNWELDPTDRIAAAEETPNAARPEQEAARATVMPIIRSRRMKKRAQPAL